MFQPMHRRKFLRQAAWSGAGLLILNSADSVWGYAANQQLNVALIGVGGRGEWFVDTIPKLANVVALCDVNARKIAAAFKRWSDLSTRLAASSQDWERQAAPAYQRLRENQPKTYSDFRVMLEEMGARIDAVVIATPDHTHAVAAAAAIRAGKNVFCEKPLTRTLHESRTLRALARTHRVATAMGNQGTYSGAFRRALELIRNGTLGEIKEVHIWNDAGGADKKEPPQGEPPLPEYLQWDLWLGPAAYRPYHPDWLNRNAWRDFGTSQLGNWASHSANLGFMALKVHDLWLGQREAGSQPPTTQPAADNSPPLTAVQRPAPRIRVSARHTGINRLSFPRWEHVQWEVPARAGLPPITLNWYNGAAPGVRAVLERAVQDAPEKQKGMWNYAGTYIVGTQGCIHTTGHNMWFRLLPADQFKGVQCDRPETIEDSRGPEVDWLAACRGGKPAWSNFEYADALNEFLMLGNIATQFDPALEFDPRAMKIVNNPAADALLRSEYRSGWTL